MNNNNLQLTHRVHGYPLVATFNFEPRSWNRGGRVIIVDRGAHMKNDRYVASVQYANDGAYDNEWSQGHYCHKLTDAFDIFKDLVQSRVLQWIEEEATV